MILAFFNCCDCCVRQTQLRSPTVLDYFAGSSIIFLVFFLSMWLWVDMRKVFKDDYKK